MEVSSFVIFCFAFCCLFSMPWIAVGSFFVILNQFELLRGLTFFTKIVHLIEILIKVHKGQILVKFL